MWSRIISVYYRVGRMAVPGDRERLVRLETRAREADIALRQLKSYVQLLKQKAGAHTLTHNHTKRNILFSCYR